MRLAILLAVSSTAACGTTVASTSYEQTHVVGRGAEYIIDGNTHSCYRKFGASLMAVDCKLLAENVPKAAEQITWDTDVIPVVRCLHDGAPAVKERHVDADEADPLRRYSQQQRARAEARHARIDERQRELDALLDRGVTVVGPGHVKIERAVVDAVLVDPMLATRGVRIVPSVKGGKPIGFKLYAIRPSSIFARLQLQNGDTIHRVNGMEITTAELALVVYSELRTASRIELALSRRDKPVTLLIDIE